MGRLLRFRDKVFPLIQYIRGGILTGHMIDRQVQRGRIQIENYDPTDINPNSYNLAIGNTVTMLDEVTLIDLKDPSTYSKTRTIQIPEDGLILRPGSLYLVPTMDNVGSDYYEPIITGRSSVGRLGIQVHLEAGFADIGYKGKLTLQLKVTYPTKIYAGMKMLQIYFLTPHGRVASLYSGHYAGENSIASKWSA